MPGARKVSFSEPAECLRGSESRYGGVAAQRLSGWGTTKGRVLCEALLNVRLDRLIFVLTVFLSDLRSGKEGVVGVRQAGL
jgi:hypothetical protein